MEGCHVLSRGKRREGIVVDDEDWKRFVKTLVEAASAFQNAASTSLNSATCKAASGKRLTLDSRQSAIS